jgi:hypothetical protein
MPTESVKTTKQTPHEERIGRIKAVVFTNATARGERHSVRLRKIYKREGSPKWEETESFDRDDLPVVIEVARRAWLWIYSQSRTRAAT